MPDYTLVPVDHQPDFGDYSLVPVDYDPFAADGVAQQPQIQQAQAEPQGPPQQQPHSQPLQPSLPQPPAMGVGQLVAGASANNAQATTPANSFGPDFAQAGQPAENDQPTPEGGLTIKNLDTRSADLRTIPGVTPSPDDTNAEADGEAVFADPSHKEFKSTEKNGGPISVKVGSASN
jgi:hypothetical protein